MPTAAGNVNGRQVGVLRDTGCTGVVARGSLVSECRMIGKEYGVTLTNDSKKKRCPVSHINVECPFYTGIT